MAVFIAYNKKDRKIVAVKATQAEVDEFAVDDGVSSRQGSLDNDEVDASSQWYYNDTYGYADYLPIDMKGEKFVDILRHSTNF